MEVKYIWCLESDSIIREMEWASKKKYIKFYEDRTLAEKAAMKIFRKAHKDTLDYLQHNLNVDKKEDAENLDPGEKLNEAYYDEKQKWLDSKPKLTVVRKKNLTKVYFKDHLYYGSVVRHTLRVK